MRLFDSKNVVIPPGLWNVTSPFPVFTTNPFMASTSNASEPESPEEESEEIVQAGFDPLIFWDQYRQLILLTTAVLVAGLAGFGIYEFRHAQDLSAAAAALAGASTEDEYNQIIAQYPGTTAAGDATLLLATKLREAKRYDDAIQTLQGFLDKYPTHPLIEAGDLGIAETLEAQGKLDEAISRYQEVAAKYPDTYAAPAALLAQANILKHEGKMQDAHRAYENFVAQFPDSLFAQQAMAEMRMLRAPESPAASGAPGASGTNAAVPASLLDAIRAAAQKATTPGPGSH